MSFIRRLRSGGNLFVFLGGILLAIFLFLLIAIAFFEQAQLKAVAQQRAMSELEKQAAALGYFIAEQKDALREVANGHAIKTYLANQALGMSMEYGLRASLLYVVGQLQRLKERKEVNGNPVYRYLAFFDLEGGALADDTTVMPDSVSWDRSIPLAASNANLLFANRDEYLSACLVVPVVFKGGMVGFVMAEMDFPRALDNLLLG